MKQRMTEMVVEDIPQLTERYRNELQDERYRAIPLKKVLRERIEVLRNEMASNISIEGTSLLHTLDIALSYPHLVDAVDLASYMSELIQVMENLGAGSMFTEYIDRAIELFQNIGLPVSNLYLAKADYIRIEDLGGLSRKIALDSALKHANTSDELAKSIIGTIVYYLESGRQKSSIKTCQEALNLIKSNQVPEIYEAEVLAHLGINHFDLFNFKIAQEIFEQCYEAATKFSSHVEMATALHYLGRIALVNCDLASALKLYLDGLNHQEQSIPSFGSIASVHLRLGELLTSAGVIQQALEHLFLSQELFRKIHYSLGIIQVDVAIASIYASEGKMQKAGDILQGALRFAREGNLARGELICLEKIFLLSLSRLHILRAIASIFQALGTGHMRLLISYLLRYIPRQLKQLGSKDCTDSKIDCCPCSIHYPQVKT